MPSSVTRLGRRLSLSWIAASIALGGAAPAAAQGPAGPAGVVPSGAFRLAYKVEGRGRPALVIGFPDYYRRVFSKDLRDHLRLVFVDHRGSAPSPGRVETSAFRLDVLVDDIERLRAALELDRVAVIGHSGHSFLALEYAKAYPERVTHVVLVGIAPDLSARSQAAAEARWERSASEARKAALAENRRRLPDRDLDALPPRDRFVRNYLRDAPKLWYDPAHDAGPLWEGVSVNVDMMAYVWGVVFRDIDITKGLDRLKAPVLVALGRHDYAVAPPESWEAVRGRFRDLTIAVFERSGHTPPLEEPAEFDRRLLDWIDRHP